jgi:hypothetical protein
VGYARLSVPPGIMGESTPLQDKEKSVADEPGRPPPPHPPDDHDLERKATAVIAGFAQGIGRGLVVVIWEWIKGSHHL